MVTIFSLASIFTGTIAWFTVNRNVDVGGMSVSVKIPEGAIDSLTVHKCDLSASTSSVLQFDSKPSVVATGSGSVTTASGIQMENYSTLNQTQPVLLLLTFNDGKVEGDIEMTATSDTNSFVSAATAQNISAFPFSSAVTFRACAYSDTYQSFPFTNVQTTNYGNKLSFVTFTKDNKGNITGYSYNRNLTIYDGGESATSIKYLAIILDYFPDAIDYIIKNTTYEVFNNHNNCIDFVCDWLMEL